MLRVSGLRRAGPGRRAYAGPVRLTEFWSRMDAKFGPVYAQSYALDQVIAQLDGRTVRQALDGGVEAKAVWRAVCDATAAPAAER